MNPFQRYRKNAVQTAPKQQILILLLEEAIKRLHLAADPEIQAKMPEYLGHLHHTRQILIELDNALDFEAAPELCTDLQRLYRYSTSELIAAGSDRSTERIEGVSETLTILLHAWRVAA